MRGGGFTAVAVLWLCAGCAMPSGNLPAIPAVEVEAEQHRQLLAQARDYYAQLKHVDEVAFKIRTANRAFCKDVAAQLGLFAGTVRSLPHKYRSVSAEALNLSWATPGVISVAAGSPAEAGGITPGDQILALNGAPVPAESTQKWIDKTVKINGETPITLTVRHEGHDRAVSVTPVMGCAIPILLRTDVKANAFTDSRKIVLFSGVLRLTQTDADLAVIIGHELAHVNLGHRTKKMQNALLGKLGGAAVDAGFMLGGIYTGWTFSKHLERVGARAYSVGFEREADYVGAYYAARAGYGIAGAENIWRAMSLEDPNSIRFAKTHPTTPARFVFMQKVITEIADKEKRGLPLVPNIKVVEEREPEVNTEAGY
ncbi:MAG TPA: M48 family metallopeptidase [Pseudolabrys sp.]|nr:M48 family metallopeptidase [Pseudolabrys sp.]